MSNNNSFEAVYNVLVKYVRRNRWNSSFTTNDVRERMVKAGLNTTDYLSAAISKAVKNGMITRIGDAPSTSVLSRGRKVGVYMRTSASYSNY